MAEKKKPMTDDVKLEMDDSIKNLKAQSDYEEVMADVAEELLCDLNSAKDGDIIDIFQTGSVDPWQIYLFYGTVEQALMNWRTDKRCKTVFVHVQAEGLATKHPAVTPGRTLLEHLMLERIEDYRDGRLQTGSIYFDGQALAYNGAPVKGRHVVLICDLVSEGSDYLTECVSLCHEMKAAHVVGLPIMVWNPDLIDSLTEEDIKEATRPHKPRPLS